MDPEIFRKLSEKDPSLVKFYLDLLHRSINARMAILPSISALCATLLVVATFNKDLLPLNNVVKTLVSILLLIIPPSLFFYNSQLKDEQNSYIKTLDVPPNSKLTEKFIGYFPDLVIFLITSVILIIVYLIWCN